MQAIEVPGDDLEPLAEAVVLDAPSQWQVAARLVQEPAAVIVVHTDDEHSDALLDAQADARPQLDFEALGCDAYEVDSSYATDFDPWATPQ